MLRVTPERDGTILVWTVDRPSAKNALDQATFEALSNAVDEASKDARVRAAVLTGAGDTFVSGGDLRELRGKTSRDDAERLSETGYGLSQAIGALPFPVIAALGGAAIGGGAELAVACDLRVATESAIIAFKQARLGVTTAWGTVPRLVALVGAGAAARLLYAAKSIGAREAKELGLVDDVASGSALDAALALADEISSGSPSAIRAMKQLVRAATEPTPEVRALERELFATTWSGADHIEAVEAYFARRPPRWRGP